MKYSTNLILRAVFVGFLTSVILGTGVFLGVRLAMADPGGPPTTPSFTFAGVLRNPDGGPGGSTTLTFTFRRNGLPPCAPAPISVTPSSSGAFTVPVPISGCPSTFFDGTDITYDIAQAGESTPIARDVAITPVPYARFADQAGVNNDCPAGYARNIEDPAIAPTQRLCVRRRSDGVIYDQLVKVGNGSSAFWVDRFEASMWEDSSGVGRQRFTTPTDFDPAAFPRTGQWTVPLYALSRPEVAPANNLSWFQMSEACASSGKRLPTGEEWLRAARGTVDPGENNGTTPPNGVCNTAGSVVRFAGRGTSCASAWGAQDMIGNLWEATSEWASTLGFDIASTAPRHDWGDAGRGDGTWNIATAVYTDPLTPGTMRSIGLPAAVVRGGSAGVGAAAGIFAITADTSPLAPVGGFRCVVPR